jgi:hypothetical protein
MVKVSTWMAGVLVGTWLCSGLALACRYNVRDVGFVDLDTETYHFYGFAGPRTSIEMLGGLQERAAALGRDSNLSVEIIQTGQLTNHPALKYVPPTLGESELAAVLVSPDGQSLLLQTSSSAELFREALPSIFAELTASALRDEILRVVTSDFAAVLLIEGQDAASNTQARNAIGNAIEEIRGQMKLLPKAIASPPAMVLMDVAAAARERILLWSLGLGSTPPPAARAAVLYGRARWIGPLMKGEEITARNVAGILSIIGADCECGLDISWTQGTRLLVRWTEQFHTQLAKSLGFDPENPMVKVEVSRIVARRGSAKSAGMGYQEVSLDGATNSAPAVNPDSPRPGALGTVAAMPESRRVFVKTAVVIGALAFTVVLAGLFILVRGKQ